MKRLLIALAIGLGISATVLMFNSAIANADTTPYCVNEHASYTWGFWPFTQTVTDISHICYNKSTATITYRSTQVDPSSLLCDINDHYSYKLAGGVGTYYVEWVDGSHMTCPTNLPGVFVHRNDWIAIDFALGGSVPNPTVTYKIYQHS